MYSHQNQPPYPGYPPGPAPYHQAIPPGKPKGGGRKVAGILLMVFGALPLLLGCAVVVKNFVNARQKQDNPAFAAVAWHDLATDQVFPDYLTDTSIGDTTPGWSRQGIAKETTCAEAFRADFAAKLAEAGCRTALRATYVDIGGTVAVTIGVAVVGSYDQAQTLDQQFNWSAAPGPLVFPVAVPGTPAASWTRNLAVAGGTAAIGFATASPPYLAAISVGPVDGRSWATLPGEWSSGAREQQTIFKQVAGQVVAAYGRSSALRGEK